MDFSLPKQSNILWLMCLFGHKARGGEGGGGVEASLHIQSQRSRSILDLDIWDCFGREKSIN